MRNELRNRPVKLLQVFTYFRGKKMAGIGRNLNDIRYGRVVKPFVSPKVDPRPIIKKP
ncbi:hypothetical protein TSUD_185640 [Trifolium subterraneum]|uniref:Uncharacterized protein n=1 Tax=Trifolium subterraneum TaxID=3900 RepID=A0A2Z6MBA8_TRISU|nr:hypothetical protein TSUD_185640 [Trifolium subterraneum]